MIVICLTGGKGVGKSTLIREIRDYNNPNIRGFMADKFILNTYQKNQVGYNLINQEFGIVFNDKKGIDKKKLGAYIFTSKITYDRLTKITNKLIKAWIEKTIIENIECNILIIELAIYLKFEKLYAPLFDKVILIKSNNHTNQNHISDSLNNLEINADFEINQFENGALNKIIDSIKNHHKINKN